MWLRVSTSDGGSFLDGKASERASSRPTVSEPISILLFVASYPPRVGGYEKHVHRTASFLSEKARVVTVLTPRIAGRKTRSMKEEYEKLNKGLSVIRFPAWWVAYDLVGIPKPRALWRALRSRPERESVVVTETRFFPTSWVGWLYSRLHRLPLIHIEHGASHPTVEGRSLTRIAHFVDHLCGMLLSWRAHRVIAVSSASQEFLTHLGVPPSRIEVIPGGVSDDEGKGNLSKTKGRGTSLSISIGYVGRLSPGKGIEELLTAFTQAARHVPRLRLSIVGEGELRERLERMASSQGHGEIEFLGRVDPDRIGHVYESLDVVVIPSIAEGFGLVMLEAARHGCAIIASDLPAFHEILTPGEEFLSTQAGNVESLAWAIRHLAADPRGRKAMAAKAKQRVADWPTWDDVGTRIWHEICAASQHNGD